MTETPYQQTTEINFGGWGEDDVNLDDEAA